MLELKHKGESFVLYFTQMDTCYLRLLHWHIALLDTVACSWACWSPDFLFGYLFNHAVLYSAECTQLLFFLHTFPVVSTIFLFYYCSN